MRFKEVRFVLLCIIILIFIQIVVFPTLGNGNNPDKFESDIENIRISENIPSIQASIIIDNKHVWTGQFGNGTKNTIRLSATITNVILILFSLNLVVIKSRCSLLISVISFEGRLPQVKSQIRA